MANGQINLRLPVSLETGAKRYARKYGFRNLQDLITAALREKVFNRINYDENFTKKEIKLIDQIIAETLKTKSYVGVEEAKAILTGKGKKTA